MHWLVFIAGNGRDREDEQVRCIQSLQIYADALEYHFQVTFYTSRNLSAENMKIINDINYDGVILFNLDSRKKRCYEYFFRKNVLQQSLYMNIPCLIIYWGVSMPKYSWKDKYLERSRWILELVVAREYSNMELLTYMICFMKYDSYTQNKLDDARETLEQYMIDNYNCEERVILFTQMYSIYFEASENDL